MRIKALWALIFYLVIMDSLLGIYEKNILIISSYSNEFLMSKKLVNDVKKSIENSYLKTHIYYEELDCDRTNFNSDVFVNYFVSKYESIYFDVIIACNEQAFEFVKMQYESQFLGRPVVFCGVTNFKPGLSDQNVNYTGVSESIEFDQSVKMLKNHFPKLKNVYIFGNNSVNYNKNKIRFFDTISNFPELKFSFIENLNIAQIALLTSKFDENSAVILFSNIKDKTGLYSISMEKAVSAINSSSECPIISFWDWSIGYGVLGAKMIDTQKEAQITADMVIQILNDVPVKKLPVVNLKQENFFNS